MPPSGGIPFVFETGLANAAAVGLLDVYDGVVVGNASSLWGHRHQYTCNRAPLRWRASESREAKPPEM